MQNDEKRSGIPELELRTFQREIRGERDCLGASPSNTKLAIVGDVAA